MEMEEFRDVHASFQAIKHFLLSYLLSCAGRLIDSHESRNRGFRL
jgi:hypothetical protein